MLNCIYIFYLSFFLKKYYVAELAVERYVRSLVWIYLVVFVDEIQNSLAKDQKEDMENFDFELTLPELIDIYMQ